jgi:outer membrane protein TolC
MNHLRYLSRTAISLLFVGICCQFGCQPQQPLFLGEKGMYPAYYKNKATDIEYPNVDNPSLPEVCNTTAPLTLDNPDPAAYWELTLEEAVQMSLKNSKVIRTLTGVGYSQAGVSGVPSALLQSPGAVRTVYDPALIESDPRYGQEAALAAFDAQLGASARWTKSDTPYRTATGTAGTQSDVGTFNVGINKIAATGTQFSINHVNQYQDSPTSAGINPSWSSYLEGGFRHPLLRGTGIEFNRIAGPSGQIGVYGGVAVARINTDMSLNDFEMATRNLVADVEKAYWNLYYAYHRLESVRSGRKAALETWRTTKVHHDLGGRKGQAHMLAQAEQNFFSFELNTKTAQNNLFKAEQALRYIIGLAPADGRIIRPSDDPITAPIALDWHNIMCEALFRSPELRKQKWAVKQRELECLASKSFLLPKLDLEANYRVAGADRNWMGSDSAYGSMAGGNYTGWMVGLSASTPLGYRQEQAAFRNAQLNLAKARAILQEQELELTHQLGASFQEISLAYQQIQTTLAAYRAATREVEAVQSAFELESVTLDQVLQAQRRQSDAETGYYSAVIDYNLAIMTLHYRKGSLLEYNNVCLSEGPWPTKAYFDAKRRARERDAGHYFNYGYTLPGVVSRGMYQQHQHGYNATYNSSTYEELPTALPGGGNYMAPPIPPTSTSGGMRVIETESTTVIPTPVLPKPPGGNTPVSFTTPEIAAPTHTLTPSRNMRYVK